MHPHHAFPKIHFNIILLSMPVSSKRSPSARFPHPNPVYTSPFLHTCYMSCPSHYSWFDHPNNIWWVVQSTKLKKVLVCRGIQPIQEPLAPLHVLSICIRLAIIPLYQPAVTVKAGNWWGPQQRECSAIFLVTNTALSPQHEISARNMA
jgi:hypothetical protein